MKLGTTLFLRAILVLIGIGVLGWLLVEPQLEGVNAHATLFAIYFQDPFLAYVYVASIPFFIGLYQAFKMLGNARRGQEFFLSTAQSVRTIKYCAIALMLFAMGEEIIIMLGDSDDRAGGVFIGALVFFAATVVAIAAAVLEQSLRNISTVKPENN